MSAARAPRAGRLDGKVVLVTGGSRGIGEAIVRLFAAEGAAVAFSGRSRERGERLQAEVTAAGGDVEFACCDVSDEAAVAAWVDGVAARRGGIDAVVNNAASGGPAALEAMSLAEWERVLRNNVTSMFLVCRAAIPHLRAAGGGSIVNLGSSFGVVGAANASAYALTKAAAISLSKSLALELADDAIRVNALCPGGVRTPFSDEWFAAEPDPAAARADNEARHPLGRRQSTPEEQARAALFLVSDDASFVTGHALLADGGYTAQ